MLKETVTYEDFNGIQRTEDVWFNMSTTDLMQMFNTSEGDPTLKLKNALESSDMAAMLLFFKDFMLKAYGEKSADGRRFVKSEQISEEFSQTAAFEALFMKLVNDENGIIEFIKGVLPSNLAKEIDVEAAKKQLAGQGVIPMV